jgi:hypothetical protein
MIMKTKTIWTTKNPLDTFMNVLILVVALGMMGWGTVDFEWNPVTAPTIAATTLDPFAAPAAGVNEAPEV